MTGQRVKLFDCVKKGYVMEGFPQNREQALGLQAAGIYPTHCGMFYVLYLKPMGGGPGLPGNAIENAAATTVAANGGLWTLGFNF